MLAPICSFVLGYTIGSLPTAFLLVKWKSRIDVRGAGSGNVGALNASEVSGSKLIGAAVLILDLAKGMCAVFICSGLFGGDEFWIRGAAGLGAVAGHNYPVWLRFRGGRGLATAAGVMFAVSWPLVVIWCLVWLMVFGFSRSVHGSNILASICTPPAALPVLRFLRPGPEGGDTMNTVLLMSMISLLILIRHVDTVAGLRGKFRTTH